MKVAKIVTTLVAAAAAATSIVVFAQSASAVTPPWETTPLNASESGTLTLYNAAGNVITSGSVSTAPLAAYIVGSAPGRAGDTGTILNMAQPNPNAAMGLWNKDTLGVATTYPLPSTGNPANIVTLSQTHPVSKGTASDFSVNDFISEFPNGDTSGPGCAYAASASGCTNTSYQNLYQLRLVTAQGASQNPQFEVADILVNPTAGTWTQVFPTPASGPTATTTTLTATETSPQPAGTTIHLTATVAPSAAGTVQFKDGTTNIGSAVTVSSGQASTSTSSLSAGVHTLHAEFTPSDTTAFSASTGDLAFTISSVATATTTTLGITPPSPITVGTSSTLTATLSPSGAVGSVQFKDGATNIGSAVPVTAGQAQTTTSFSANTHNVTAVFTPTNATDFAPSTSSIVSYVVNTAPATPTTTTLGVSPASPQTFGTSLGLTGTVSPGNAVGSIQFLDGSTVLATVAVSGGSAMTTSSTLGAGSHSLTAKFVPTVPANFGTSTSSVTPYTINQASTTTTLGVSPASPQVQGTSLALTATVSPGSLAGSVQFFDGVTTIGSPVVVSGGHATLNWAALTVGDHTLKATFQPSSANYSASTSDGTSFTVQKPPPSTTSTTLQVTPGGPVGPNTVETLHATITPASAVGSVQFMDGATNVGAAVAVAGGVAQTTTTLPVGAHSLKAVFTPTDSTNFSTSQSQATAYTVLPPATDTTTHLGVDVSSPVTYGSSLTLTATVTPSTAGGTVVFKDGSTVLDTKPVSSGTATLTTVGLGGGSHTLTAVFTPSAPLDFNGSTSPAVPFTVNAATTATELATTAGPVGEGQEVTLQAAVTPSAAAGSVTFKNGTTTVGSVAVSNGNAVFHTTHLPVGTASLTATFVPAAPANYSGSTTDPLTLEVIAPPSFDSVTSGGKALHSGDTLKPGQSLTLTASGFQPGESVEVDVHSAVTKLATTKADGGGHLAVTVSLPTTLAAGTHTLTATGSLGTASFAFAVAVPGTTGTPTPPAGSGAGGLADTGSDVFGGLLLGSALAAAGVVAMLLGRRRHRGLHRFG